MIHLRLLLVTYAPVRLIRNAATAFFFVSLSVLALPAQAEPVTLVALGDSLTAGYGLPPDQGLVPQLQSWLAAQGAEVTVVNAGVSGDTTLMVTLGGNDMLRGLPPEEARANLSAILEGAKSKGLPVFLVGMEAPGNYGAEYKAAFDAIYADLAAEFGATLYPFFFQGMTEGNSDPAAMRPFMLEDGIHPNAEGVAKIVADLGPALQAFLAAHRP
jgi:acyl-CoA thioesterase-1